MKNYNLIIGRHCAVNYPNYLLGAAEKSLLYGSNCLMIHSGSPQSSVRVSLHKWKIEEFKLLMKKNNLDVRKSLIIHGPYIVNLANLNKKIFSWSVDFLISEIIRMEELGASVFVIHPGTNIGGPLCESLLQISSGLNYILEKTKYIKIALETTVKKKNEVGSNFENLAKIIYNVKNKDRIGICWDTCHLYNSGYDIKNDLDGVIREFENFFDIKKILVIHINDSVFGLKENKDRHANIGEGKIGLVALKKIVWHGKFNGIPKILETPKIGNFASEINLLKKI